MCSSSFFKEQKRNLYLFVLALGSWYLEPQGRTSFSKRGCSELDKIDLCFSDNLSIPDFCQWKLLNNNDFSGCV